MASDDDADYVDGYDCSDEPRPDSVVYQPLFQELGDKCLQAANLLVKPLNGSEYESATIRGLKAELKKRTQQNLAEPAMFAVAGDMAAGKSSVINSILSMGTIARKGDGGGSCTWVVQRFMKKFDSQPKPFAAHVHFFNRRRIKAIFKALLTKYYRAVTHNGDEADEGDTNEDRVENFADIRTVLDTFMALFCDMEEFETEEKLVTSAEELLSNHLEDQAHVSVDATTVEELLFKLQPYTYTLSGDDYQACPCPWPHVSVIDFGLDHPLLNEGIIFVDSPGQSDANKTRAKNAMEHQSLCTHKITVADISRAKDDSRLRDNLAQGYYTRGSGNTILVLTHGDSIDEDTQVGGTRHEKEKEEALFSELQALKEKKKSLNKKRQKMSKEERYDTAAELHNLTKTWEKKSEQYETLRMDMRNRKVVQAIQKQYKDLTGDPKPLTALVVGNEAYKQHVAGYDRDEKPTMSVQQTKIPALRYRIFQIPAEGKLNCVMHLATTQLPSLVHTYELYCAKTHMARQSEIEAIILRQKQKIQDVITTTMGQIELQMRASVLSPMKVDEPEWAEAARSLCKKWRNLYHGANQLPLLRNNGFRKGTKKNGGDISWNAELTAIHEKRVQKYFKNLLQNMVPLHTELQDAIKDLFIETKRVIKADPQFNLMALDVFLKSFDLERPEAISRIINAFNHIQRAIGSVLEATISPTAGSYTARAMSPIYDEVCQLKKGRGAPDRRMDLFEKKVGTVGGVWSKVHSRVDSAFEKLLSERLALLSQALEEVFNNILDKFRIGCDEAVEHDVAEKEREEQLRQMLQKNVILARQLVDGDVYRLAMECKNYSSS